MKKWLKNITGITAKEQELEAKELEVIKVRDPKAYATRKKEPWVNVLDMQVNEDNIRNGFFELDWNKYFIEELIKNGYGVDEDPEEEIVDRWFRDIVYNMLADEGMDTDRGAGYINVVPIDKGKSEVS
jgi:rhodanese-related sulfurtransferase